MFLKLTPSATLRAERCRHRLATTDDLGHGVEHGTSLATDTAARVRLFGIIISRLRVADVRGNARGVEVASNHKAKATPLLGCVHELPQALGLATHRTNEQGRDPWEPVPARPAEFLAPVSKEAHEVKVHHAVQREDVQTHAERVRGKEAASLAVSQHEVPAVSFALVGAAGDKEVDPLVTTRLAIILAKRVTHSDRHLRGKGFVGVYEHLAAALLVQAHQGAELSPY